LRASLLTCARIFGFQYQANAVFSPLQSGIFKIWFRGSKSAVIFRIRLREPHLYLEKTKVHRIFRFQYQANAVFSPLQGGIFKILIQRSKAVVIFRLRLREPYLY